MTGVVITAVDATIVVLALPEIQRSLHIALSSVIWVVVGYLLVIALLAFQVGRLGEMGLIALAAVLSAVRMWHRPRTPQQLSPGRELAVAGSAQGRVAS
jgi:MFS family permease